METPTRLYGSWKAGQLVKFVGFREENYPGNRHPDEKHLKVDQIYRLVYDSVLLSNNNSPYWKDVVKRGEHGIIVAECSIDNYFQISTKHPLRTIYSHFPQGWFEPINMTDLVHPDDKKELIKDLWNLMHLDDRLFRRLMSLTIKSKKNV